MKLYKYNNGRGQCAISVKGIISIWPVDKGELELEHTEYYAICYYAICYILRGGTAVNHMNFTDKVSRDKTLEMILGMMEEPEP